MPKGYVIVRAMVTNPTQWAIYAAEAGAAIKKHGGTALVRGGRNEVIEGEGRARNVVLEFESFEAARAYALSQDYQAARKLRETAGVMDMVVAEGM
jgi:uncharacterized protein (DUF1330 family)